MKPPLRTRIALGFLISAIVSLAATAAGAQPLQPVPMVPGRMWATELREGEIKRKYDWVLDRTEVWLQITPRPDGGHPNPTTLYFAAIFPGRTLAASPPVVWLRAQSDLTQQPRRLRSATLALSADGKMLLNVSNPTGDDGASLNYPCGVGGECGFDGVLAPMPTLDFFSLLQARHVFGEAMGFPFTLDQGHLSLLTDFARELVPRER